MWAKQRPGGKAEKVRTTRAGSNRADKMDNPIYLRNFITQNSNRYLYGDLKGGVADACGCRPPETVTKRPRKMDTKIKLISSPVLTLCEEKWIFRKSNHKKKQLVFATNY